MLQPRQNSRLSSCRALLRRLDSLEAAAGTAMNAVDLDKADVCPVLVASLLPASPSLLPYCRQTYFGNDIGTIDLILKIFFSLALVDYHGFIVTLK